MDEDFFEGNTQTEFNSNIATLQRIDNLLKSCVVASMNEDVQNWFKLLANLRREAIVKMEHKKQPKKQDCIKDCVKCQCEKDYEEILNRMDILKKHEGNFNLQKALLKQLDNYEIFLRDFMNKKGMLLKDNTEADLDFL